MAAGLSQRQRDALLRQFGLGRARVLAIGIDDYDPDCGFAPRTTSRRDALGFADCFRDIPQLGADAGAVRALVSGRGTMPSRGEIVKALRELVKSSAAGDRLIVYFSGRAHRFAGDPAAYLVPQDAFAADDPGCLVSLALVKQLLAGSPATHKLMILDVCVTGPGASPVTEFEDSLRDPAGAAILASSAADAPTTTRSPNPQHSLFTALLLPALRGEEPEALTARLLTIPGLHEFLSAALRRWSGSAGSVQRPFLHESADTPVLADFSGPLLSPGAFELDGRLFDSVELTGDPRPVSVKEILKDLSRTHYSQSYLEQRANAALGEHLAEDLGRVVSRLRARFKWASSAVTAEGAGVTFPDGHYSVRYEATEKTRGVLVEELALQPAWLDAHAQMGALLECLQLEPDRIRFALRRRCEPARCVPKLEASGWQITSELAHKVEAEHGECTLILEKHALTLVDLPLRQLFAEAPDRDAVRTAAAALAVFNG
ncbi:caspase family protein [Nannocystis pusilla]|uniref:Caspase family protein n=1 Tax=Nannocystis pusilla TaxID=889268 RepID=A0ABS7U0D9_9BACT|nr:caspase family protein [Nannocystis pusilla]MBZ5713916.1 caspase family protein [Nannocystis pusilla]